MVSKSDVDRFTPADEPWLELAPSRRVKAIYVGLGSPLVALPATFLLMGWNEEPGQTAILIGLLCLVALPTVHAATRRLRFYESHVSTRIYGIWIRRRLRLGLEIEELVDNPNPYAWIATWMFRIPNDIILKRPGVRRTWMRVPGDLLSGLGKVQYGQVLERLRERYGQTSEA